ncbi:capsular polysaccharide biosynthesis protein [Frankia sp. EI5c]|uniref:hypothetical protein n=1 Tax=Frankia sp. EI5c TaxID=683316 RepID=UPI0007C2ACD9|nr:hypothetical protein [Frankia sp. EI5c]OAA25092.1 capsular polysaccharide biosynthesis protein [Frankia sp. EI5c]
MQLNGPLAILLRRWRLTAVGVIVTLVAAIGGYVATPVSYEGSAQVFLLPSATSADTGKVDNPYLGFGQALRITAEVLSRLVSTAEAVDEAAAQGATAGYMVGIPTDAAGPVLNVQAKGPDRAAVVTTVNYVVTRLGAILDEEQQKGGAPRSSWFVLNKITQSPLVTVNQKARYTRAVLALAVCSLFTFLGVLLFDRFRSPRPAAAVPAPPGGDAGRPGPPEPADGLGYPDRPGRSERPDYADHLGYPARPDRPERSDRPERPGYEDVSRASRPATADRATPARATADRNDRDAPPAARPTRDERRERPAADQPNIFEPAPQKRSENDTERTYRIPLRRPNAPDDGTESVFDRRPLGTDRLS